MAFQGSLSELHLPDIIQLVSVSGKSGVFRLSDVTHQGDIWLHEGRIVHAQHEALTGEEAVSALAIWRTGEFRFEAGAASPRQTIQKSNTNLLMEAARRLDEWRVLSKKIPSVELVPEFVILESREGQINLNTMEWLLLSKIDGQRSVKQIATAAGMSVFESAKLLYGLVATNLIRLRQSGSAPVSERPQSPPAAPPAPPPAPPAAPTTPAPPPPPQPGGKPTFTQRPDEIGECWICDGRSVFEYDYKNKQLIQRELPPQMQGKAIAEGPLPFLFGADAAKIKQRYWIHPLPVPPDVKGEYWLEAYAKTRQDAVNCQKVHVIIAQEDFLPKGLVIFDRNFDPARNLARSTFTFENREVNWSVAMQQMNLFNREFYEPKLPFGWKKVVEKYDLPYVSRQSGDSPLCTSEW